LLLILLLGVFRYRCGPDDWGSVLSPGRAREEEALLSPAPQEQHVVVVVVAAAAVAAAAVVVVVDLYVFFVARGGKERFSYHGAGNVEHRGHVGDYGAEALLYVTHHQYGRVWEQLTEPLCLLHQRSRRSFFCWNLENANN